MVRQRPDHDTASPRCCTREEKDKGGEKDSTPVILIVECVMHLELIKLHLNVRRGGIELLPVD